MANIKDVAIKTRKTKYGGKKTYIVIYVLTYDPDFDDWYETPIELDSEDIEKIMRVARELGWI